MDTAPSHTLWRANFLPSRYIRGNSSDRNDSVLPQTCNPSALYSVTYYRVSFCLRLAHADEAAVIFAGQRPEKRAHVRTLVEETDRVDTDTRLPDKRAIPI